MRNERGVVAVLAVVFIGLFALFSGLVGGTIFGARTALKGTSPPIDTSELDKSGQDLSLGLIDQLSRDLKKCREQKDR